MVVALLAHKACNSAVYSNGGTRLAGVNTQQVPMPLQGVGQEGLRIWYLKKIRDVVYSKVS